MLQKLLMELFLSWKPAPPTVEERTKRDITLSFDIKPFSFLSNQLIYRVEKKEKIPPWVVVYSGGKLKKTIDNLAPSHPHRFRFKAILKSSALPKLAATAIKHYGDEKAVYEFVNGINDPDNKQENSENTIDVDKKPLFEGELEKSGGKLRKTIDNLAPSHPHRFRFKAILKSSALRKLAAIAIKHYGDEKAVYEFVNGINDPDNKQENSKNTIDVDKKPLFEGELEKSSQRVESQWSDERWTSTESDGTSALCFCMAVSCGYLKQVQQMLEERPELISVINYNNGSTPLATAVKKGNVHMVRYLLSANAEIEQRCSSGQTPLMLAVLNGHIAVTELLLEKGADLQARDLNQLHVVHYAVDSCRPEMVSFVLDKGGDVHAKDNNSWTPLFRAICQGARTDLIEVLVRRGSDLEVTDRRQLTLVAAARLLKDRHGRRRDSILRLVDTQYQHEKIVANFTRLTKKISSVHTLLSIK